MMPLEVKMSETRHFSSMYCILRLVFPQLQQPHVCLPYLRYDDLSNDDKSGDSTKTEHCIKKKPKTQLTYFLFLFLYKRTTVPLKADL